ncbi:hypothetical protein MtrunA17_Chr1g0158551 [Medicago truncatula]|uniref:Uncharacterized protein n=1 Tax=Medicago truncatula TaxID=3880 RepID=A0A396JKB5_MEDTR|nr:hypothetical protein MtrunA17_Chr1g0158551 [Medicago truncatula]
MISTTIPMYVTTAHVHVNIHMIFNWIRTIEIRYLRLIPKTQRVRLKHKICFVEGKGITETLRI